MPQDMWDVGGIPAQLVPITLGSAGVHAAASSHQSATRLR